MELTYLRGTHLVAVMPDLFAQIHHLRQTSPQAGTICLTGIGGGRYLYLQVYPLFNYRSKIKGWVPFFQYITEWNLAEKERQRLY